jgi:hypothetical protein
MAHLTCLTPAYRTCLSDFPAFLHHCNRCVRIIAVHPPTTGLLMTAGWDSTLRYWDLRLPPPSSCVATAALPGRAYTLSASTTHMVVGTSERHVLIYHTRRWAPQVASDTCDGTHAMQQWVIAVLLISKWTVSAGCQYGEDRHAVWLRLTTHVHPYLSLSRQPDRARAEA